MVPSKLSVSVLPIAAWRTTTWITVLPKQALTVSLASRGELLLGLPYLRNRLSVHSAGLAVNYCLGYRTSETIKNSKQSNHQVNYCLVYHTSETTVEAWYRNSMVKYCLIYGTSETRKSTEARSCLVKYCLIYSASETNGTPRAYL